VKTRSGFATIVAITLIGLVAAALANMGVVAKADFRRTANVRGHAQLTQLLLVGAADVAERSQQWGTGSLPQDWSVGLPGELSADGATLLIKLRSESDHSASAHIRAAIGDHTAQQELHLRQTDGVWQLVDVELQ
jgi:type II secretory pathway component PulK